MRFRRSRRTRRSASGRGRSRTKKFGSRYFVSRGGVRL